VSVESQRGIKFGTVLIIGEIFLTTRTDSADLCLFSLCSYAREFVEEYQATVDHLQ